MCVLGVVLGGELGTSQTALLQENVGGVEPAFKVRRTASVGMGLPRSVLKLSTVEVGLKPAVRRGASNAAVESQRERGALQRLLSCRRGL